MITSRKSPTSFTTLPSLLINGSPLELVSSFKYLGVTLTSNLSWSTHINEICSKVKKLLVYIYHQFTITLFLFLSFLPNAISLWNSLPSSFKDLNSVSQFKQNISYLFYNYHEYSIHIVHIYLLIHLSISSLIINPLLLILFCSHYKFGIVIDALYISFAIECLLCFNKRIYQVMTMLPINTLKGHPFKKQMQIS